MYKRGWQGKTEKTMVLWARIRAQNETSWKNSARKCQQFATESGCPSCILFISEYLVHLIILTRNLSIFFSVSVHSISYTFSSFISPLSSSICTSISLQAVCTFQNFFNSLLTGLPEYDFEILQPRGPQPSRPIMVPGLLGSRRHSRRRAASE